MKKQINLDFYVAVQLIAANPGKYGQHAKARADRIQTPERKRQAIIAAGRSALAEVLFELHPELKGNFTKLTKVIRAQFGEDYNFETLNITGARALGYEI